MVYPTNRFQQGDRDQLLVQTPFGKGLVLKARSNVHESMHTTTAQETIKEVRLLDWEQGVDSLKIMNGSSRTKGPMLYTTKDYDSIPPKKGDEVITPYGRGVIKEIVNVRIRKKQHKDNDTKAKDDQIGNHQNEKVQLKYQVSLTSWRLAGRSRVKCFLFASQVKVVRSKTLHEMDALERIDYATAQKGLASKLFSQKKHNDALILYSQAVDAVRYIQHTQSTSNESRADLLVVIVTCSNNAATCCIQLLKFEEAGRFARNALILLNALYNKRGMKIHGVLLKDKQLTDAKVFGEWRGKSCLIIARAELKNDLITEALGSLKKAKEYITEFTKTENGNQNPEQKRLKDLLKEILKLKGSVMERRRILREKEKARAQAMFADSSSSTLKKSEASEVPMHSKTSETNTKHTAGGSRDVQGQAPQQPKITKKVSFAEELEETRVMDEKVEDKEEPWYEEHKEALVLLTLGGLVCLTTALGLRKR